MMKSTIVINTNREYLEFMVNAHKRISESGPIWGDATPVYEFILAHGQEFHGTKWTAFRGSGYRKMEQNYCFANCWYASLVFPELTYYEGYAYCGLMNMHHAWCVDERGRVADFTWRKADYKPVETEWEYFGVGFDSNRLREWMHNKPTSGVLFDWNYNSSDLGEFVVTA